MLNRCKNELVVKSNNQEIIAKEHAKLDELIRDYMKQALSPSTVRMPSGTMGAPTGGGVLARM